MENIIIEKHQRCANYPFCDAKESFLMKNGICVNCDFSFGKWRGRKDILDFVNDCECPICFETTKMGVVLYACNHPICIDCAKKCYYNPCDDNYDLEHKPKYPYSQQTRDLFDKIEEKLWNCENVVNKYRNLLNDPCIQMYKDFEMTWKNNRDYEWDQEHLFLRKCPLCRTQI